MLVFAGITPHPPLLIPDIGKKEIAKVEQTKKALNKLEEDLYLSKPDVIVVISPHGSLFPDAFCLNANTNFSSNFAEFGDLKTKLNWQGEPSLASTIAHAANDLNMRVQLISEELLDHGTTVPLFYLTTHLPNCRILPVGYSLLDNKQHLDFGELMKESFMNTSKRVAVIASGDLSHALATGAPAGFSPAGTKFDQDVIELLENHNTLGFSKLDPKLVEEAAECGYRSILILLGILQGVNYNFKNYSYEGPFGVGYLVGNFVLD